MAYTDNIHIDCNTMYIMWSLVFPPKKGNRGLY